MVLQTLGVGPGMVNHRHVGGVERRPHPGRRREEGPLGKPERAQFVGHGVVAEDEGGPSEPPGGSLGRRRPGGAPEDPVAEGVARGRLGGQGQAPASGDGERQDVNPGVEQADRGAGAGPVVPGRGLVDVDFRDPFGEAPDVAPGHAGELLVHREPVDVGADGASGELLGAPAGAGPGRSVMEADHEADRHLVVRVEVGVVVPADGQRHQRPARDGSGHLEAGGGEQALGGGRRHQVLHPTGGPCAPRRGGPPFARARSTSGGPGRHLRPVVGRTDRWPRGLWGTWECSTAHAGIPLPVAYWIMKAIISPFLYLLWPVKVEGRENVPTHGPAVLAANHQSFCDSFFLPLVVHRRVTYVAKAEYFDNWKIAWFFRAAGQIPMNRSGGDASQRALDTAKEALVGGPGPL